MPTYEYRCPQGHDFEKFYRKISDAGAEVPCPTCGQVAQRRMSAGAGLLFKGSGFYITDYGKDGKKDQGAARKGAEQPAGAGSEAGAGSAAPGGEGKPSEAKSSEARSSDGRQPGSKSAEAKSSDGKASERASPNAKPSGAAKKSDSSE